MFLLPLLSLAAAGGLLLAAEIARADVERSDWTREGGSGAHRLYITRGETTADSYCGQMTSM